MLGLGHQHRYYLYRGAADMRKGFDGLSGLVRNEMGRDPLDGDIYIFVNQRRNMVRLLRWDSNGYALYSKRLEQGSYELPQFCEQGAASGALKWTELLLILEGISLQSVRYRKRYVLEEKNKKSG
jgi:transposase